MSTSFTRTSADVCAHLLLLKPPFSEHTFTRVVHDLTNHDERGSVCTVRSSSAVKKKKKKRMMKKQKQQKKKKTMTRRPEGRRHD